MLDYAIVGGGVTGCYCAYRLSQSFPGARVAVFEASDRFGGRLHSLRAPGVAMPIELGGMFVSDLHENLFHLIGDALGLELRAVDWRRGQHFLRGAHMRDGDFITKPAAIPFALSEAERGKHPLHIAMDVVLGLCPDLKNAWPLVRNANTSARATYRALKAARHNDRPLYACDFADLLSELLSEDACALLRDTLGSLSMFGSANAVDAIWNLLLEMAPGQRYFHLPGGYQSLPDALRARSLGVDFASGARLERIAYRDNQFVLNFDRHAETHARHLILALPPRALQKISYDATLVAPDAEFFTWRDAAVRGVPACKLFLVFDRMCPQATSPAPNITRITASMTDLAIRQCYLFDPEPGDDAMLVQAVFADAAANSVWRALGPGPNISIDHPLIGAAVEQLSTLLGAKPPHLKIAYFTDWDGDGCEFAWQSWVAGQRSWRTRAALRQPVAGLPFFICGEAFSERQGWVEGALNTAELVAQKLQCPKPSWLNPTFDLEPSGD